MQRACDVNRPEHYGMNINYLSRLIRYTINSMTAELTGEQCRLLEYISMCMAEKGKVYQRDIESEFGIKRSSVASILGNLEKSGFIVRETDADDTRLKTIRLTEKGKCHRKKISKVIDLIEGEIVRDMSGEEKKMFMELIKRAINNLESAGANRS